MGSDMYMNPPEPRYESLVSNVSAASALEWAVGAMTHGWKVELIPNIIGQDEGRLWSVRVFKGEWI